MIDLALYAHSFLQVRKEYEESKHPRGGDTKNPGRWSKGHGAGGGPKEAEIAKPAEKEESGGGTAVEEKPAEQPGDAEKKAQTAAMHAEDTALVQQVQAGDKKAFDTLTRKHRPGLVRTLALMTGDGNEAEDLAQTALMAAFTQIQQFNPEQGKFANWLLTMAKFSGTKELRRRRVHAKPGFEETQQETPRSAESSEKSVVGGLINREMRDSMWQAIHELPEDIQQAYILSYVENRPQKEIAQSMGISHGTLRVQIHRAHQKVKQRAQQLFDEQWQTDEPAEIPPEEKLL